jgi:hypothetical protein
LRPGDMYAITSRQLSVIIQPDLQSQLSVPHIVIARHGDFDEGESKLNANGRAQIEELADRLKARFGANDVAVYSSTGPRSKESAQLIAEKFNVESQELTEFSPVDRKKCHLQHPDAYQFLVKQPVTTQLLIIVMAGEFAKGLFDYVGKEAWGIRFGERKLERGQGLVFNTATRQLLDV